MSEIEHVLDVSRLVSTLHLILEGQTALENRLNQAISRSSQCLQTALEAEMRIIKSQIQSLREIHQTHTLSSTIQQGCCDPVGSSLIVQNDPNSTTSVVSADRIPQSSELQGVSQILKPMEPDPNTSTETFLRSKTLKEEERKKEHRENVISEVMNKMNQADQDASDEEDDDSSNEWTLGTGYDRRTQSRRSWSGFLHYYFGISAPNSLIGHKGSRVIHPSSPFVTGAEKWL